ncbi:hypothetical protein AAUPMC_12426, partial [Pasteurella multocida subsp. multocida str. Anand1_cattle]
GAFMHIIKTLISVGVAFSLSACLSLEGVEIAA